MTREQEWQVANLMSKTDSLAGQVNAIGVKLERWQNETQHDQAVLRGLLALIGLLVVAQGATMLWLVERTQTRTEGRLHALETRVEKLERVAY